MKWLNITKHNTIRVEWCPDHEMAFMFLHGKRIYTGNYWDFHPYCHGGFWVELAEKYGDFNTPDMMAFKLESYIKDHGGKVKIWHKQISKEQAKKYI